MEASKAADAYGSAPGHDIQQADAEQASSKPVSKVRTLDQRQQCILRSGTTSYSSNEEARGSSQVVQLVKYLGHLADAAGKGTATVE